MVQFRVIRQRPFDHMHLTRRGTPQHPGELSEHSALLYLRNGSPYNTWRFSRGDETLEVEVHGDYLSDDGEVA